MKRHALLVALSLSLAACRGGAVAGLAEPDKPTADNAMGELVCDPEQDRAEPLTVDWSSADRTDLEVAMRDGLVVVAYDCERFRVLDSCRVSGGYSFAGVSLKEEMVQISGRGELHANFPVGKANFSGIIDRGSSIDLALVTVGKQRTSAYQVARGELEGDCEGATHFVKSALVGAFALGTGTSGEVGTVAEVFSLGEVGGSSSSEHQSLDRDGSLDACGAANPADEVPPAQCQALLRVELVGLRDEPGQSMGGDRPQAEPLAQVCPTGFVREGSKCTEVAAAAAFRCDFEDTAQCEAQCEAGSLESCHNLALELRYGDDSARAEQLFERACEGGVADSCAALAYMVDWEKQPERAATLLLRACDAGDATACRVYGHDLLDDEPFGRDLAKAKVLMRRGMELGDRYAASTLAWLEIGDGNYDGATNLLDGNCSQGNGEACSLLGALLSRCEHGRAPGMVPGDVPHCEKFPKPDAVRATVAFERACRDGYVGTCVTAGRRYGEGKGVKADVPRAIELLEIGCPKGWYACEELGRRYEEGDGVPKDLDRAFRAYDEACQINSKTECWLAARVAGELGRDVDKRVRLEQGCKADSKQSCDELTAALEKEGKADEAKAIYQDVCTRMLYRPYCDAYERLGGTLEPDFQSFEPSGERRPDDF